MSSYATQGTQRLYAKCKHIEPKHIYTIKIVSENKNLFIYNECSYIDVDAGNCDLRMAQIFEYAISPLDIYT